MDADLATLALSGATTLVTLMATDAWNGAKSGFSSLYARFRPEQNEAVIGELENSRAELAATPEEDRVLVQSELVNEWQGRIRRFLVAHPDAIEPLREVLEELSTAVSGAAANAATTISMHGTASQGGRVYQQGQGTQINR